MSQSHTRRSFLKESALFAAGAATVFPATHIAAEHDAALQFAADGKQDDIRIGTLIQSYMNPPEYIRQVLPHGFESFQITFWKTIGDTDVERMAGAVREALADSDAVISSVAVYGNPLGGRPQDDDTIRSWEVLIDTAHLFGCDIVAGFTGRVIDEPIDESIPRLKEVFGPLASRAADKGLRIAFENCEMGGTWKTGGWNIAHNPAAWELIFDALPYDHIGLEWEPCHQLVQLIDPIPQLRKWAPKVFHLHGKDATVQWDVVRTYGIGGGRPFVHHRTAGFGDTNWTEIIAIMRQAGFKGSIDIEGWHDPVYKDELEMTGQVHSLNYLKQCRTTYVPNPEA
jgi:sugar phosphate isomerase/epimerase